MILVEAQIMAFTIRLAAPHDRSAVRRFVVINHLNGQCSTWPHEMLTH